MATKEAEMDSEQLRKQFLECPLCFDKFRKPKVLPCQHTFCLQCLQDYIATRGQANTIPCPLCKQSAEIPENDVSKLPINFTLANLSDFVKGSLQIPHDVTSRHQQCEACDEVGLLQTFCTTSELWLCPGCTKVHKKIPSLSSHCLCTTMEVNEQRIEMASNLTKEVKRVQQDFKQKLTNLTEIKQKVHSDVDNAKEQIKSAAEELCTVIKSKEHALLEELSNFEEEVMQNHAAKHESVKEIDVNIDNMLQLLNEVEMSSGWGEKKGRLEIVKEFLTNRETGPCSLTPVEEYIPVCFVCSNLLGDVKNMDMGCLHGVHGKMNTRQLIDRPVSLQEITLHGMGEPVQSLAYSTFTNMLLAVGWGSPIVINPDSGECSPFLSTSSKREMEHPQCVAYSEDGRHLFVIDEEEGKRVITSYTHDRMFPSIITSRLTWPTSLAVYGSCIFVCDGQDKSVYILNMSGEVIKELKETSDHKALFTCPFCISVGGNGRFAVSDDFRRVHIFDTDYTLLYTYVPVIADRCLTDVQVLPDGSVVVCDWSHGLHYIPPDFSKKGLMNIENSSLSPWSLTIHERSHTIYIGTLNNEVYSIKY